MIDSGYFFLILLIFLKLLAFFAVLPVLFPTGTPNMIKIGFSLLVAVAVAPYFQGYELNIASNYTLFMYIFNEVISGIFLGLITNMAFEVFRFVGSFIDVNIGLSMLSIYDPNSRTNSTLIERIYYSTALVIFLLADGHHMLIKLIVESYRYIPLGSSFIFEESITLAINAVAQYFIIGIRLAIPIILIILLTDVVLGLVAKTVPSLNVMILGLPIKLLVGLATFIIALPVLIKGIAITVENIPDIFRSIFKAAPILFIFASEEKTEEATPRKKSDARKKGQVAKSKEVSTALGLLGCTLLLIALSEYASGNLKITLSYFLNQDYTMDLNYKSLQRVLLQVLWRFALVYLPIAVPIMLVGILANYIQTGFIFTSETIKPKLDKINPINGFKRIFSSRSFIDLAKNLVMVALIGYIGYSYIKDNYTKVLTVGNLQIQSIGNEIKNLMIGIFSKAALLLIAIALIDYIYQRYMFNKDLKMTKQEVKEEYKQDEGDPQLKSKMKQRQREISTRRMMQAVPEATVIVTNPTHYAVALKYEDSAMTAPKVVAKGVDLIALKIKEIAKENKVPIIENRPLARSLYEQVDIDKEIPENMYQAVAEILAALYKMKKNS